MSQDEITPARMRDLGTRLRAVLEYMDDMTRSDALHRAAVEDAAAALRAAADRDERLTATLAARDALLRRAMAREKFIRGISPSVAAMFDEHDAPLAAEIAAALGGKTDV